MIKKNPALTILIIMAVALMSFLPSSLHDIETSAFAELSEIDIFEAQIENLNKELFKLRDEARKYKEKSMSDSLNIEEKENLIKNQDLHIKELENRIESLAAENDHLLDTVEILDRLKQVESRDAPSLKMIPGDESPDEHIVYLTFDDGPSSLTSHTLDILKKYNIKATFFVNGRNSSSAIESYKRIVGEGHTLGSHCYSHDYSIIYKSTVAFRKDLLKLENFLYEHTGARTEIMRFPGGSDNRVSIKYGGNGLMYNLVQEVHELGYEYFDWNVDSTDSSAVKKNSEEIKRAVLSQVRNKQISIVLMHDTSTKGETQKALPGIIEDLLNEGYIFKALNKNSFKVHYY